MATLVVSEAEARALERREHPSRVSQRHNAKGRRVDGIWFASGAEATRYGELRQMEQAGEVTDLVPHPKFELDVHGIRITTYRADFQYVDRDGRRVVEDVKGRGAPRTREHQMKVRLMLATRGIVVVEVER